MRTAALGHGWTRGRPLCAATLLVMLGWLGGGPSLAGDAAGEPAFLGVQLQEATERPEGGARVTRVVEGSPATEADLRVGDIVIEFEGAAIRGPLALTQRIHSKRAGDTVKLTVVRDGVEATLDVELGTRSGRTARRLDVPPPLVVVPEDLHVAPAPVIEPDEVPELVPEHFFGRIESLEPERYRSFLEPLTWQRKPTLGVQLVETTPELRRHLGGSDEAGVLVSKVLSGLPAEKAGMRVGDLIVGVDGEPVATSAELVLELRDKVGRTFGIEVVRDGRTRALEVTIPEPEVDRPTGPRA